MEARKDSQFPSTRWTLIARVKSADAAVAAKALDEVCARYRYPLYCYLRCLGVNHHDAQDVLHDFLAKLIRLDVLERADASKGRLRSFLAVALRRFLANCRRGERHRRQEVSAEVSEEARFTRERMAHVSTPEAALDRVWAATLLRSTLEDLAAGETEAGRGPQFTVLEPFLSPSAGTADYRLAAEVLGQKEGSIRQMVRRLRGRFRDLLRERVAETLSEPTDVQVDEEMMALRAAMAE